MGELRHARFATREALGLSPAEFRTLARLDWLGRPKASL